MITGAAAIMVSVFAAFALAETLTIKSIGVGHGDRGVRRRDDRPHPAGAGDDAAARQVELVGPGPLARFADRLGFTHVEDEATVPTDDGRATQPASGAAAGRA